MSDISKSLAERLEKEGQKNIKFFEQLSPDVFGKQIYSDGAEWTIREIFSHVVETEQSLPALFKSILAGESGVPDDFDLTRYNEGAVKKMNDLSFGKLIEIFAERRVETVKFVANLSEEDLQKMGKHPSLGEVNLLEMIKMMYLHVKVHFRDVKRLLRGD